MAARATGTQVPAHAALDYELCPALPYPALPCAGNALAPTWKRPRSQPLLLPQLVVAVCVSLWVSKIMLHEMIRPARCEQCVASSIRSAILRSKAPYQIGPTPAFYVRGDTQQACAKSGRAHHPAEDGAVSGEGDADLAWQLPRRRPEAARHLAHVHLHADRVALLPTQPSAVGR